MRTEIDELGVTVEWLEGEASAKAWKVGQTLDSRDRYGLDAEAVSSSERVEFGDDSERAALWLGRSLAEVQGPLVVLFGPEEVFRVGKMAFLKAWPEMFVPGRDDAIIYSESDGWCCYVSHENELEVGWRTEETA